ncbi:MAG: hypothetical protein K0S49_2780, partial [Microbacterium sp.]|nr:hypothetical protein [Microbacterium sp.]
DLENVVWDFPDTGLEFYWDVNGTDWNQPFRQVTATLHVNPTIADSLAGRQACYVGEQDSTTACPEITASPDGDTITASASDLAPHETLTLAVGFEAGRVRSRPTTPRSCRRLSDGFSPGRSRSSPALPAGRCGTGAVTSATSRGAPRSSPSTPLPGISMLSSRRCC